MALGLFCGRALAMQSEQELRVEFHCIKLVVQRQSQVVVLAGSVFSRHWVKSMPACSQVVLEN